MSLKLCVISCRAAEASTRVDDGTSVRAASGRDVYLELVKDSALAIYSPAIARRVAQRVEAIGHFNELTADRARVLAGEYGLDYLITEQQLDLPVANQAGPLMVYSLGS